MNGNKINVRYLNRLIMIGGTLLVGGITLYVLNYIGFLSVLSRLIFSIYPVFLAIFLSFLLEPFILRLIRAKIKRAIAVILAYLFFIIILGGICLIVLPSLVQQAQAFIENLPAILDEIDQGLSWLNDSVGMEFDPKTMLNEMIEGATANLLNDVGKLFEDILYFSLSFVGAVFLSFDYPQFKAGVKRWIPHRLRPQTLLFFRDYLPYVHKYVSGILLDCAILWVITSLGLWAIGINYPIIFGLVVAVFDLIPLIGPYIGGAPVVIIGLTTSLDMGVYALIVVILVQFIESNFVQPLILHNVISLHPLAGILGLIALGTLFGFVGMIISPLVMTALKILIRQIRERHDAKRGLPLLQ